MEIRQKLFRRRLSFCAASRSEGKGYFMKRREQRMIHPPFFEIGPKTYVYGKDALAIALAADQASE